MSSNHPTVVMPVPVAWALMSAMWTATAAATFVAVTWLNGGPWLRSATEFAFAMLFSFGFLRLFRFGSTPEQLWARARDLPLGSVPASRTRLAVEAVVRGAGMVVSLVLLFVLLGVSGGAAGILVGTAIMNRRRVRTISEFSGETGTDLLVELTLKPGTQHYFTRPSAHSVGQRHHRPADGLPAS